MAAIPFYSPHQQCIRAVLSPVIDSVCSLELFYFVPLTVATLMELGSIKSFDLHFPVCAFSRVCWLFTYLRRIAYSCTRSLFLYVCVVSVHTKAHMCRSEDNMWELWVLGKETMDLGLELNSSGSLADTSPHGMISPGTSPVF